MNISRTPVRNAFQWPWSTRKKSFTYDYSIWRTNKKRLVLFWLFVLLSDHGGLCFFLQVARSARNNIIVMPNLAGMENICRCVARFYVLMIRYIPCTHNTLCAYISKMQQNSNYHTQPSGSNPHNHSRQRKTFQSHAQLSCRENESHRRIHTEALDFWLNVILSPKLNAMPCVLLRMRI